MARTRGKSSTNTNKEEAPVSTDTTEAPTEESTDQATVTEAPAENQTQAQPEVEIDLTEFNSAVETALEDADTSTGDLPEAALAKVTESYRKLDGPKAKNAAKKAINDSMKSAMNDMEIVKARAYLQISENALSAGTSGGGGSTRTPTDPTEAHVQKVATLTLAYQLATTSVADGVAEDWQAKVEDSLQGQLEAANQYKAWVESNDENKGDEPEVSVVVKNAVKLAEGKSARAGSSRSSGGSTYTGERRDIGKHILNAFSDKAEGTFLTIAEIRKTKSDEYGDAEPSAGAISARLFPGDDPSKCTLIKDGVQPGTNESGKKGATKVAVQTA